MSSSRVILHEGFRLELSILPLSLVRPHEEVVPAAVADLASTMSSAGVQRDPIIADSATHVILDGMHRSNALKRLGAKSALVCEVDYAEERVLLGRWLRSVKVHGGLSGLLPKGLGMEEGRDRDGAMGLVDDGEAQAALLSGGRGFLPKRIGPAGPWDTVRALDGFAASFGCPLRVIGEEEVAGALGAGESVLYVRPPTKRDVLRAGETGPLLPPKSTRHSMPARPAGLPLPLSWLMAEWGGQERLEEFMKARSPRLVPSGRKHDGAVYLFT